MHYFVLLCLLLIPCSALAENPQLLFDQGHRQVFVIEKEGPLQLGSLAETFHQQGWYVSQTREPLSARTLAGVDALIISGAFSPLAAEEISAVLDYLRQGGKLAVMVHIGQPLIPLLNSLGVEVGNRVINEKPNQPNGKSIDFAVSHFQSHQLTDGLQQFNIYGGWPLRATEQNSKPLASSSPEAWVDMDRDKKLTQADLVDAFTVAVSGSFGRGSFVVFGDDAIFQNQFLRDGNKKLAENLTNWLKPDSRQLVEI